jgi:hypothetical protein
VTGNIIITLCELLLSVCVGGGDEMQIKLVYSKAICPKSSAVQV